MPLTLDDVHHMVHEYRRKVGRIPEVIYLTPPQFMDLRLDQDYPAHAWRDQHGTETIMGMKVVTNATLMDDPPRVGE